MHTLLPPKESWSAFLPPLAKALSARADEHRENANQIQQNNWLSEVIENIAQGGENSSMYDQLHHLAQGQKKGLSQQNAMKLLEQLPKWQAERTKSQAEQRKGSMENPLLASANAENRKAQAQEHGQSLDVNKPIINEINERRLKIPQRKADLKQALKAIDTGDVGFLSPAHFAKITGMKGLTTPQGKLLANSMKTYYGMVKEYFGGNPSDFESQTIEDLLAQVGSNEHANRVAVYTLQGRNMMDELLQKSYDDIVRENGNRIPFDLGAQISQRVEEGRERIGSELGKLIDSEIRDYESSSKKGKKKSSSKKKLSSDGHVYIRKKGSQKVHRIPREDHVEHPDWEMSESEDFDMANQ